jgi:DNA polymerase-1
MQEKLLILVDGSSYLYRAFHALPALTNSKGTPTGAVYGFTGMLRKLLHEYDPEYAAVVFDAKGKTFRNDIFAQYKANRPPMPETLAQQIEPIKRLIRALGVPLLEVAGVEADDVIGTLVKRAQDCGFSVIISSGDKDLAQLVNNRITVMNTMDGTSLDPKGVEARFGVPPALIVDYLALIGDTIDNVPGIPKVGPKTATRWLNSYGSLEQVMANSHQIKGKVGENLRAHLTQLPIARKLITVRCDVRLDLLPSDLKRQTVAVETLRTLYAELEFKTWLSDLLAAGESAVADHTVHPLEYETILAPERLGEWLQRLQSAGLFAFDTETTSLDYMLAELVGVSFATGPYQAAYVPFAHDYPGAPVQLSRSHVLEALRPLLENERHPKVGQNLKYDLSVLARYGISLRGVRFDTMLESYVLDSTANRHDLDSLAIKYLGHRTIRFEDIAGKGAKQLRFNQIDLAQAAPYAAEDADIVIRLHQALWPKLCQEPKLQRVLQEIEMPLIAVLSQMERNGVRVDANELGRHSKELATRIQAIEREAHHIAGEPFNLGSPKQIQRILFDKFKLPIRARTPNGQPSTSEAVLQDLATEFSLPQLILQHRSLAKLKSTYADALMSFIHPLTGRVHTSYHQAVASTGRLSSSDPNLQNIPVRTPEGRRIRQAFIASPGYQFIAADYSQIELRIMAHLSEDPGLRHAFAHGQDIHRTTAAEILGIPLEQVTHDQRRRAKTINFGLMYGMSAFGLGRQLGLPRDEAQDYIELYFARYPGVKRYMDKTRTFARAYGYVETLFGRRLYLPEINSPNMQRRQYAERTAINAPMQGTAADIIKRAMIRLDQWLKKCRIDGRMIMQVHDELVFEVTEEVAESAAADIADHMSHAAELSVPLIVDTGFGQNWDEAH